MVNILSFSDVRKLFRITMDTDVENTINAHVGEWKLMKFKELESGLHLFSSDNKSNNKKRLALTHI